MSRHLLAPSVALLATAALALPAPLVVPSAAAQAEQIVFTFVDEPAPWEFEDPCTGVAVHGVGIENGIVRVTELGDHGDQGVHARVKVSGTADLFDSDEKLVGRWTYRLVFTEEIPPDGQGALHFTASGPVTYVGGRTAILHVFHHVVFDKGGAEKLPARDTASCGGRT